MNLTLPAGGTSFALVHAAGQGPRNPRPLRELKHRQKEPPHNTGEASELKWPSFQPRPDSVRVPFFASQQSIRTGLKREANGVESCSTAYEISWTTNNPGGSPVHYGVVHYGTDRNGLAETAKSPIRLNPDHASTVFRVCLDDLRAGTTYYYRVDFHAG